MNNHFLLQLELNLENHMVLLINKDTDTYTKVIGYITIEDCRRPGKLVDFPHLEKYYDEDNEWDDFRNLLIVNIYTFEDLTEKERDDLTYIAVTFIEFKPAINFKVEFYKDKSLLKLYEKCRSSDNMDMTPINQNLINRCENPIHLNLLVEDYNYLTQQQK